MARTLARLVHNFAKQSPMAEAILSPFSTSLPRLTYASLSSRACNLAAALHARSYQPGDVIASDLPNTEDNVILQVNVPSKKSDFLAKAARALKPVPTHLLAINKIMAGFPESSLPEGSHQDNSACITHKNHIFALNTEI
jgi:hypothetical protein